MSDEKVIIPSNEEVLDVQEEPNGYEVTDMGNEASAEVIESDPKEL